MEKIPGTYLYTFSNKLIAFTILSRQKITPIRAGLMGAGLIVVLCKTCSLLLCVQSTVGAVPKSKATPLIEQNCGYNEITIKT